MLDPAMKERHWQRIEEVTGWKFDIESEGFQLRNVMEAPLLKSLEDIEVCAFMGCSVCVSVYIVLGECVWVQSPGSHCSDYKLQLSSLWSGL